MTEQELVTITIPESEPATLEQTLRGAIYGAHTYYRFPIIKCGHRVSVLIPIWEYERLKEKAQETMDLAQ